MDSQQRMIDTQARIISERNEELRVLKSRLSSLEVAYENRKRSADFYDLLQQSIANDPVLASAWQQFIIVAKLCDINKAGIDRQY